jgi:hypothetical protein
MQHQHPQFPSSVWNDLYISGDVSITLSFGGVFFNDNYFSRSAQNTGLIRIKLTIICKQSAE